MTIKKILLLNGPPRSGKDTAALILGKHLQQDLGHLTMHYKFAEPFKNAVHAAFGLAGATSAHFEATKDEPMIALGGLTPREAYISMSEDYLKPTYGKSFFGLAAVNHLRRQAADTVVTSDCGFLEEVQPLVDHFGKDKLEIIQVHRPGRDFSKDSRSYIQIPGCNTWILENDGSLEDLRIKLEHIVELLEL